MNLPTKITVVRLAMIPFMVLCYCLENTFDFMFIITGAIFVFASTTDYLDGYLARKYKMVTSLGKFLDPIADKILVVSGLIISLDGGRLGEIPYLLLVCVILIIAREFIISLFRQIAALQNYVLAADKLGKYKTAFTMIGIGALLYIPFGDPNRGCINATAGKAFWWIALISILLATIVTIWSGINYIYKNRDMLKGKKDKNETIKDEDVDFPDVLCIEALEACLNEQKISIPLLQSKLGVSYARAFKLCFWIEMMGFVKIEDNKKILSLRKEDIDTLRIKKQEKDALTAEDKITNTKEV